MEMSLDKVIELEDLRTFLSIIFNTIEEEANQPTSLIAKITKLCTSIDDFHKNNANWQKTFGFSPEQCMRSIFVYNLLEHTLINCQQFKILCTNFPEKELNFEEFLAFALATNNDNNDNFVSINGHYVEYKEKMKDYDSVKRKVYRLVFFRAMMSEGDVLFFKSNATNKQRLAIFSSI
jgi:hypothetical protein